MFVDDASEGGEVVMREVQRCWKEPRDNARHTREEGRGSRAWGTQTIPQGVMRQGVSSEKVRFSWWP